MSDDDTDASDDGRWRKFGLAWYHWLLALAYALWQLLTVETGSGAEFVGAALGATVAGVAVVYVLVAGYGWLRTKVGAASGKVQAGE